jgi:FAD/FMN-containing dehydrogenase
MPDLLDALRAVVGASRVLSRPEELFVYECDGLTVHTGRPTAVAFPREAHEVQGLVRACRANGVPFVPRGAGTGLSGGALPAHGAVVIECSRMDRVLELDAANRIAVVQPGVVNAELSKLALPHGLFYAPDPSSQLACTIGGNVAENSGGPHTLKYGATSNHVLALEVVLPDGELLCIGSQTGWGPTLDLVGAFVGSEGTLGIVTAATLRLEPLPEGVETLLAIFPDVVSACRAVGVYAAGLPRDAGAVLIVELDGAAVALPGEVARVRELTAAAGATRVEVARDADERARFWRARKGAFGAMGRLAPDLYVHDAVVPRTKLPEVIEQVCAIGDRHGLRLSNVFHAGDGNLHPNISFDRRDPDELRRVLAAGAEILALCVAAGGVITGEHGIGTEKRDFMGLLFGEDDLEAMRRLRAAFDPDGCCNPGKLLPTPRFCAESDPKARGYERVPFA